MKNSNVRFQFRPRLPQAALTKIKKGGAHRSRKQFDRNAQKRADRREDYSSRLFLYSRPGGQQSLTFLMR